MSETEYILRRRIFEIGRKLRDCDVSSVEAARLGEELVELSEVCGSCNGDGAVHDEDGTVTCTKCKGGLCKPAEESPPCGNPAQPDWSLCLCVQSTGNDHVYARGSEASMRAEMQKMAKRGSDVWLLDPDGNKHLPSL